MTSLKQKLNTKERVSALEVRNLKGKLQDCILKNQKLNQMIVNMSKQDEPPDIEVDKACIDIEYQIEGLIRTHYNSPKLVLISDQMKKLTAQQQEICENLKKCPHDSWKYEIRHRIFEILDSGIFSSRCFGLGEPMEKGLESYEKILLDSSKGLRIIAVSRANANDVLS